jgi:hypothetical protein
VKSTRYLAFALSCFIGSSALASGLDFTIDNQTGYDIKAVYIDANSSNVWTDDVMGSDILENGASVDITFEEGQDTCNWDLKVDWTEDYPSTVWTKLNLCDISKVTLKYNRDTDVTTAFTE